MSNQKFYRVPFAASGDRAPIPDTVDPGGSVSYPQGFGPDYERPPGTDPLAKRVPRDETNQYIYDLTDNLRQYQLAGTPEWVTAAQNGGVSVPYDINATVLYAPTTGDWRVYRSLVTNNTVTPGTDDTKWRQEDAFTAASLAEALAALLVSKVITPATLGGAVQQSPWVYATAGGTANALTVALTPALPAYVAGTALRVKITTTNTGAATVNVSGLGAVAIQRPDGSALIAGDLIAGAVVSLVYSGAVWVAPEIPMRATLAETLAGVLTSRLITPETLAGAVQRGQWTYVVGGGTANAITGTVVPAPTAYDNLRVVWVLPAATNTAGAVTLNLNGLGAASVTVNGANPPAGALQAGVPAMLVRTAAGYALLGVPPTPGRLLRTTIYTKVGATQYIQVDGGAPTTTGAGTFTPLAESVNVDIEVQGGGAGGAGCPATDASGQSAAGGGGSGAWACKRTTAAAVSGATVTVGAAGAGGAAGPNLGSAGGASSVGAITAAGGAGGFPFGPTGTGNFIAGGGAGGTAGTSGDINLPGVPGVAGTVAGGQGIPLNPAPGRAFGGYFGTGGGSQSSSASTAAKAGFAGTPGVIVIKEWT